ncbi:MAG: hypothetical protein A2W27_11045 [Deltaproteobacteria bacterium RBG_16_44_11]|nr:MAG: hypothetical protein A2W27_11045 [Deltaproteobacteria bacterium RBG_16_44_11]
MGVKVKERPEGSGIWWIFIDHSGKRKAKKIGKNKRVAMEAAKKIEAKLTLGEMNLNESPRPPTLKEYIDGWRDGAGEKKIGWYEKVAVLSLKHSTYCSYRLIIDLHLIPAFGSKPINEITPGMTSDLICQKIKDGLRSSTARNIKNCLSAIMRHAVNPDRLITSNPALNVPIPKPEDERPLKEPDPFTWEERAKIESTFKKACPKHHALVVCDFRTGLRIGELIGLQWPDMDFSQKLILVQRNITRGKITTPKSRSSRRYVRMTSYLVEILKRHKIYMAERTLKQGWKSMPDWLFVNDDGTPLNYGNFIHREWNPVMNRSGLRRRTPHDMRHTYATLRLSKGDSLAEVSKEMGHSTPEITYRTYYKWLPKESTSNIDELDTQPSATQAQPAIKRELKENV